MNREIYKSHIGLLHFSNDLENENSQIKNKRSDFNGINLYGKAVSKQFQEDKCEIFNLENESGTGNISVYQVFSGFELIYNDIHMEYCNKKQKTACNVIEINHCHQGRYECVFGEKSYCYIASGDLAIGSLMRHKTESCFPLCHYHGITILIELDKISFELQQILNLLSIDLNHIRSFICNENRYCIMRANDSIEHIFSELYSVRENRKMGYMKIKILELLIFLSDLEVGNQVIETEYYNQIQVKLIKHIRDFIVENIDRHYTIAELSKRFKISPTALKSYFKGIYGAPVYAYLRTYRLQIAQKSLKNSNHTITEIASQIGYANPNKFTSAFKKEFGVSPTKYKKSYVQMDRFKPSGVAEK